MTVASSIPRIEEYLRRLYDDGDPVRPEMEELGRGAQVPHRGPAGGPPPELLARAIGARRVFELGSGYGYSALHFARAVGEGGVGALHGAVRGERRAWPRASCAGPACGTA